MKHTTLDFISGLYISHIQTAIWDKCTHINQVLLIFGGWREKFVNYSITWLCFQHRNYLDPVISWKTSRKQGTCFSIKTKIFLFYRVYLEQLDKRIIIITKSSVLLMCTIFFQKNTPVPSLLPPQPITFIRTLLYHTKHVNVLDLGTLFLLNFTI